jgi:hypothetical protein
VRGHSSERLDGWKAGGPHASTSREHFLEFVG